MDWRPIGTAPKDGTPVRVHHELAGPHYDCEAVFTAGEWQLPHNFIFSDGYNAFMSSEPTHWKPLAESS